MEVRRPDCHVVPLSESMSRLLIAGYGYLGAAVGSTFREAGWEVLGLSRTLGETATGHDSIPLVCGDLTKPETLQGMGHFDLIIHCASSGRGGPDVYEQVYLGGMRHLAEAFPGTRLIFTSSTSVYAQNDGSWVSEESPADPGRDTGKFLRQAEDVALSRGGAVARLAGLYGPGRSVLLQRFFSGEAVIEGDGSRFVNQIHRDDAARALLKLATTGAAGIFNVCDDHPLPQLEIYQWLSERFQRPLPPPGTTDANRKRGVTNKRVANTKLRGLGWAPRYQSFKDAVTLGSRLVEALGLA